MTPKPGRPLGSFKYRHRTRVNGRKTKLYSTWLWVKRSGTACEWTGFDHFCDDMGDPFPEMVLVRLDKAGGFSKANCVWGGMLQRGSGNPGGRPRDSSSLRQRALKAGLTYAAVYQRVKFLGWDVQTALTTPKAARGKHKRMVSGLKSIEENTQSDRVYQSL